MHLFENLFKKKKSILSALPESTVEKIRTMKKAWVMMTDRQFFIFMHENKVPKDVKNIIWYAEKYIFGMPIRLITTEAWNKDIKIQKMLPRDSMLFIDLADYDPKK